MRRLVVPVLSLLVSSFLVGPPAQAQDPTSIRGRVLRIDPGALVLLFRVESGADVLVQASDQTRVTLNGRPAAFADIRPGDFGVIEGRRSDDRKFQASAMSMRRAADRLEGVVAEVHPDRLALLLRTREHDRPVPVQATPDTHIAINGQRARFADIRVRDLARIVGRFDDRGIFHAASIAIRRRGDVRPGDGLPNFGQWGRGPIARIDHRERLFVLDLGDRKLLVHVPEGAPVLLPDGRRIDFASLREGERVEALGNLRRLPQNRVDVVLVAQKVQILR